MTKQSKQSTTVTSSIEAEPAVFVQSNIVDNITSQENLPMKNNNNNEPEKKKRGRKKNVIIQQASNVENEASAESGVAHPEKKIRKRRSKKEKTDSELKESSNSSGGNDNVDGTSDVAPIKKRKRRTCKKNNKNENVDSCENTIINSSNDTVIETDGLTNTPVQTEEKVIKKRGRKPKGGKITTHQLEDTNINNELPNIILHLKCSLSSIKNNTDEEYNIQSYNSTQVYGSEINLKKLIIEHEEEKKMP